MRLSSVTCCTISALLGSGVAAQANEGINEYQPKDLDLDQQPDLSQSHTAEKYQVAAPVVPTEVSRIVPPETNLTVSSESLSRRDLSVEESATPIAAIAPSESRFVEELPQVLNHQPNGKSDSFISEFEWAVKQDETTLEEVTELAATPSELEEKSAVLAKEDRAEIAEPLARFNHKAVLEFIVPTNAEESKPVAIAEPSSPATSNIALSEAPESVVEEAVFSESEEPLVLEFELLNPEVAQSFQG